jgi:hypothetical protein
MASTMIQVDALASVILPTNIVCTSTWSGLSVNERGKLLRIQYLWIYIKTGSKFYTTMKYFMFVLPCIVIQLRNVSQQMHTFKLTF